MEIDSLLKYYEADLREIIQFASPLKCEGLAVDLLRRFSKELQELLNKSDINHDE